MKGEGRKGRLALQYGAGLLLLLLTVAPFLYILAGFVLRLATGPAQLFQRFDLGLLLRSGGLQLGAAALSALLGWLAAVGCWVFSPKKAARIAWGLLLFILIPPFIHVQSWIYFMDRLYGLWNAWTGAGANFSGSFAVLWTEAFAYMPLTAGLTLLAFAAVPAELAELCRMERGGWRGFLQAYMPLALLCGGILAGIGRYISRGAFAFGGGGAKNPYEKDAFLKPPATLGVFVLLLFVLVPLVNLGIEAAGAARLLVILRESGGQLLYSLALSALTGVLCLVPGLLFAYLFYRAKARIPLLCIAALPFLLPAPIAGLSLIGLWNTPLLENIYTSPIMPAIGMTARFAFLPAAVLTMTVSRLDSALFDNMWLHYPGPWRFFRCLLALVGKEALAVGLMVFALAMGEFGMTLLITPPGYQSLTIKIYNYLHYGASETVAVLCLFMLAVTLLIWYSVFMLGRKRAYE